MIAKPKLKDQLLTETSCTQPIPAQISTRREADSESETEERQPKKQQLAARAAPAVPVTITSDEALDRHLSEWGGSGGRLIAFNGSSGIHRTLDDSVEVPSGTDFVAFLHETQKGYIKFNDDAPPDVCMVAINQDAEVPQRKELGDLDQSKWPRGLDGNKRDPWKEQIAIPLARCDAGGELFVYVARGAVALNSVADLLGRWRRHPKRQAGLIPVIRLENGTYPSKKFGGFKPKPLLLIIDWVTKDGSPPPPPLSPEIRRRNNTNAAEQLTYGQQKQPAEQRPTEIESPFNDQIPSFDEELIPWK